MKKFLKRLWKGLVTALMAFVVISILLVLALRWWNPLTSAFMIDARLDALLEGDWDYSNRYQWVDWEKISAHAAVAAIAAEDQQFPVHWGFDFNSIRKAVDHNSRGKRVRGASTISQQVAKNLFLWSGRSYVRKGLEAWFTVLIETLWTKRRILEVYLNIAEFGRGVYGVEAAARTFYGKPAAKLNAQEAARLAAVLPSPRRMRVNKPSRYVLKRQSWILRQMRGLGGKQYLKSLSAA